MITREELEKALGPIDKYSLQVGAKSAEDNKSDFHTIFIGKFKVYISEFEKSIDEDKYVAGCMTGEDSPFTGFASDDLSDILTQIKKYIDTKQ